MIRAKVAIAVLVLLLIHSDALVRAADPQPSLEFRLAQEVEKPGWQRMKQPESDDPLFVATEASLNGSHIEKVAFYNDATGHPAIGLTLTEEGAKAMEATTSRNLDKHLAIVLNGKLVSAPRIRSTISREVEISGVFSKDDLLSFFRSIVLRELP